MKRFIESIILALLLSFLLGCTAGINFTKLEERKLVLGVTTKDEIIATMGEPNTKGTAIYNGIDVDIINYSYGKAGGDAVFSGITPARSQGFFFVDDILVGKNYASSFRSDSTYFDVGKAKLIKEGQSKGEVFDLLGESRSWQRYPLINDKSGYAVLYIFVHCKGLKITKDILIVEFNSENVVTKSTFSSTTGQF